MRRLFKPDKWTPLFACMSTVAGRSGPAAQCPRWVKLRSLTVRPAGLFSPQNRTSTQSSLPSLVVRVRLTNSIRTVAGAKDSRTRAAA